MDNEKIFLGQIESSFQSLSKSFSNNDQTKISVLVAGFPKEHDAKAIKAFIELISPNRNFKLIKKNVNQFKGLVFIYFDELEEAQAFCMKDFYYQGKLIDCKISKNQDEFIIDSQKNLRLPNKIFAINIPSHFNKVETAKIFEKYGEIQEVVLVNKEIKKSKIAYVSFKEPASAIKCVNQHKFNISSGCTVTVEYARPKFTRTMLYKINPNLRAYIRQIQKGEKPYDPLEFCAFHDSLLSPYYNANHQIRNEQMANEKLDLEPQINLQFNDMSIGNKNIEGFHHDSTPVCDINFARRNDFQDFVYAAKQKVNDPNMQNNWQSPYCDNGQLNDANAVNNYGQGGYQSQYQNLNPRWSSKDYSEYNCSSIHSTLSNYDGYYYYPANNISPVQTAEENWSNYNQDTNGGKKSNSSNNKEPETNKNKSMDMSDLKKIHIRSKSDHFHANNPLLYEAAHMNRSFQNSNDTGLIANTEQVTQESQYDDKMHRSNSYNTGYTNPYNYANQPHQINTGYQSSNANYPNNHPEQAYDQYSNSHPNHAYNSQQWNQDYQKVDHEMGYYDNTNAIDYNNTGNTQNYDHQLYNNAQANYTKEQIDPMYTYNSTYNEGINNCNYADKNQYHNPQENSRGNVWDDSQQQTNYNQNSYYDGNNTSYDNKTQPNVVENIDSKTNNSQRENQVNVDYIQDPSKKIQDNWY